MDILERCRQLCDETVALRRHLHENPELSGREFRTVRFICGELDRLGVPCVNIPDGGVLARIDGAAPGRTVLLRADCDALPIREQPCNAKKAKTCVSRVEGVQHACGHDAHTAMLLTAVRALHENKAALRGSVLALFERGEEGGGNIYRILKYIREQDIGIDATFAIHTDTDLDAGQLVCQGGPAYAGYVGYDVTVTGKGGHGSRPDQAVSPIDCFAAIYRCLQDIPMEYQRPEAVLTHSVGAVQAGQAANVIPESLRFAGTCRFYDPELGAAFREKVKDICATQAERFGCKMRFDFLSGPELPVINDGTLARIGAEAIERLLGIRTVEQKELRLDSESYGFFSARYPSVMMRLGVRNEAEGIVIGPHEPGHDIDEGALPYGAAAYAAAAMGFLACEEPVPFTGDAALRAMTADELFAYAHIPIPTPLDAEWQAENNQRVD